MSNYGSMGYQVDRQSACQMIGAIYNVKSLERYDAHDAAEQARKQRRADKKAKKADKKAAVVASDTASVSSFGSSISLLKNKLGRKGGKTH